MSSGSPAHGQAIFVVEDESLIAMNIQLALEDAGARVVTIARSVAAAERILREGHEFNLAIVDLHLDDGDASHLVKSLSERRIPVLVTTGGNIAATEPDLSDAAAVLVKPFTDEEFMQAVQLLVVGKVPATKVTPKSGPA